MHDFNLELQVMQRSNSNIPIKIQYSNFQLNAIVMFYICYSLRDIYSQNMHALELSLYNGPRSNVNIQIKAIRRPPMCYQQQLLFYLSPFARDIHSRHLHDLGLAICMTLVSPFRMNKFKSKYTNRQPVSSFLCVGNVMFALSVTVCEIITFSFSKRSRFASLTMESRAHGLKLQRLRIRRWMAFLQPTRR